MRKSKHQAKPQKRRKRCWGTKNTNWGIPRQRTKSTKPTQRQAANQRSKRSQLEKHPGKHQQWAARRQANSEMQGTMGKSPRYRQINQHQSRDTTVTKHVDRATISKQCPTTCPSIKTTSELIESAAAITTTQSICHTIKILALVATLFRNRISAPYELRLA